MSSTDICLKFYFLMYKEVSSVVEASVRSSKKMQTYLHRCPTHKKVAIYLSLKMLII